MATIALSSGGYWQRVWGSIIWQTEEYVKKDFAYSIVAAFFIAVLTLLDGSATITTLYWSVIGFLAVFVARIGQHTITTPALLDQTIKHQLLECEQRFDRLTEYKLIFEIDLRNTRVRVEESRPNQGEPHSIRIMANIQLRFENRDIYPLSMKGLDITLHRLGVVDGLPRAEIFTFLAILRITSNGIQINKRDFEGMMIQERRLTSFYLVEAMIAIENDEEIERSKDLDVVHFLRVSMKAGGYQPEFAAHLHPHWPEALEEGGTDQVFVTKAPVINKDYRRFD